MQELKKTKQYLRRIAKPYKACNLQSQYDDFLHKVQREKMKGLWANKDDEAWENA